MTDIVTGHYAHAGILAALIQRGRTGKGSRVECSLFESQVRQSITFQGSPLTNLDRVTRQCGVQSLDRRPRSQSLGYISSLDCSLPSLCDQGFLHYAICRKRWAVCDPVLASRAEPVSLGV